MGDIHGNQLALQAVLEAAAAAKVDRLLVTGDLVGYYFAPSQVLELLTSWICDVVRGEDCRSRIREYLKLQRPRKIRSRLVDQIASRLERVDVGRAIRRRPDGKTPCTVYRLNPEVGRSGLTWE